MNNILSVTHDELMRVVVPFQNKHFKFDLPIIVIIIICCFKLKN